MFCVVVGFCLLFVATAVVKVCRVLTCLCVLVCCELCVVVFRLRLLFEGCCCVLCVVVLRVLRLVCSSF